MSDQLDPIAPAEAVDWYLSHREPDLAEKSLQNQRYRLNAFIEWCEEEGIANLNALTGRNIQRFRRWRQEGGGSYDAVEPVTLRGQLRTLQKFLEFAASIDAVEDGLREKVLLPDVDRTDESRDEYLDADRAEAILDYLEKFEYASRAHVVMGLLWHTGIRLGTLRAFDVGDFDPDARALQVRHRPEKGTPLKNGERAERSIAVGDHWCEVLTDYIAHTRDDVVEDHGRQPLVTSSQGRFSETGIRAAVYRLTRPCSRQECPHDRDPDDCEAMEHGKASRCPSSRSPHSIRRGSITWHLREGTPEQVVSDRMNVTDEVLEQHYDERTERERMELRREFLEDLEE